MEQFEIEPIIEMLSRTPVTLKGWLGNLSDEWVHYKENEDNWSAFDIVGHLIHGEKTDWIPRSRIVLQKEGIKTFEPFDRFAQFEESKGKSINDLLEEFGHLREENLKILKGFDLKADDYKLQAKHPELGMVNLRQLLTTWVLHDLDHISQITEEMAKRYKEEAGPWKAYLGIVNR
jgi:hypothetical protein